MLILKLRRTGVIRRYLESLRKNMIWLYENQAFVRQWAMLHRKLTLQGGHIKMVHTISTFGKPLGVDLGNQVFL
jgi:hypothetical protein